MKDDYIYQYTSKDAEEDGTLFDVTKLNHKWKNGLFNYVTKNLLSKGYIKTDKIMVHDIIDLLNQAMQIIKKKSKNLKEFDYFFNGEIELPNGEMQEIFIQQNDTGKFTIMLPEDY